MRRGLVGIGKPYTEPRTQKFRQPRFMALNHPAAAIIAFRKVPLTAITDRF